MAGSASTVRAFLLVENAGPWGVDALRDARLPTEVKDGLRARSATARVRTLLIRRHRAGSPTGSPADAGLRVFAAYADPVAPWLETTTLSAPEQLLDLDLAALGRGRSPGLTPSDGAGAVRLHARPARRLLRRARPAHRDRPGRGPPRAHLGGLAHRRRPVRGQRAGAPRRPLLRPGLGRGRAATGSHPPRRPPRPGPAPGPVRLRLRGAGRRGRAAPRGGGDPHGRRTPGVDRRGPAPTPPCG